MAFQKHGCIKAICSSNRRRMRCKTLTRKWNFRKLFASLHTTSSGRIKELSLLFSHPIHGGSIRRTLDLHRFPNKTKKKRFANTQVSFSWLLKYSLDYALPFGNSQPEDQLYTRANQQKNTFETFHFSGGHLTKKENLTRHFHAMKPNCSPISTAIAKSRSVLEGIYPQTACTTETVPQA